MTASKPPKGGRAKRAGSSGKRKPKKPTSLERSGVKKPERRGVGIHVLLMASLFLNLALLNTYSTGSTEPAAVGKVTAPLYMTTTSTSTTTSSSTTSTTSTVPSTTTTLCGGEFQDPCEDGCDIGFIVGSTGKCHPKECAPSVPSGRDGCGAFALSFCSS